ncbi:MAG: TonB-dependent receptor [Bacteroidetes bacterium]|nr:TonB-dependent receptor [Bacteroidota bacterium]
MKIKYFFIFLFLTGFSIRLLAQDKSEFPFKSISFKVFGACEQCKDRIETTLKIKGVKNANWNVDTKQLALEYNPAVISLEKIENKIVAVGHDLVNKKAKNIIYKALPSCCHYRELVLEINTAASVDSIKNIVAPINFNNASFIKGIVLQETNTGKLNPLFNASVYWLGTNTGVFTDSVGVFSISPNTNSSKLVISYVGYKSDTIDIASNNELKIFLASKKQLSEITVFSKQKTAYFSPLATIRTEVMTGGELLKAACCNLSESFETNPSVDVSYNDAVTGSKQIQLLGLSGNYTQLTVENLPGPRGLATPLGLNSIAGPWIESIQLTKGVGSVANGFESIAGQINVELKKPETAEQLLANIYVNELGKTDLNINLSTKLSSKWSSGLLLHEDFLNNSQLDFNKDGFRDLPTGNQFSLVNRYKYDNSKGLLSQFGIKIFKDDRVGGQTSFNEKTDINSTIKYGLGINTQRYEAFGKIGYVFPQQKYKSIGLQLAAIDYTQNSYFGFTNYNSKQQSFYSNLIYQSIINSTIHKFRTGFSVQYDHYNEAIKLLNYNRKELVAGGFFEYTFTPSENFSAVAGIRADNNNLYGAFLTPRLNLRYEPIKGTIIRTSAGKGQRTATIFAENNSVFVSARQVNIISNNTNNAYGLNPEVSWNKGISIEQQFKLFQNNATLSFDYFRNDFTNQVVVDLENAREVKFYNLLGKSYSNSFQVELTSQLVSKIDVRLAYRYFDVKQTYSGQLLDKPFVAKNRAFLSLDYATTNGWKINYTITYNGKKRLPNTNANPAAFQLSSYSPDYFLMNMQVTKKFNKKMPMEGYIGIENATNYFQQNAIISAAQPFSQYFDASMIWGPISGRMLYFGWRLKIK